MKNRTLFITGVSGLLGQRFISRLDTQAFDTIYCLVRSDAGNNCQPDRSNVVFVVGDLLDPDTYRSELQQSDILIHFAALTGKARPQDYMQVNARGTETLIEQCRGSSIRSVLHISTIAVSFDNIDDYYYAQSKQLAEDVVTNSGLDYAIVRPTMVFSSQSPIYENFLKLSKGPVALVFGAGDKLVQPVYLDDLVTALTHLLTQSPLGNKIYDIGGAETVSYNTLQGIVHRVYHAKEPLLVHLPLGVIRFVLSRLEKKLFAFLPITSGQLASFANDSVAENNVLADRIEDPAASVEDMARRIKSRQEERGEIALAEIEARLFCRYLCGRTPNDYVTRKYMQGSVANRDFFKQNTDRFERFMHTVCLRVPKGMKLVDAYASVFAKASVIRKKMVLMMAILESYPPYCQTYETPEKKSKFNLFFLFFGRACTYGFSLAVATVFLLPLQLISRLGKSK